MTWRDLLEDGSVRVSAPWLGGHGLALGPRRWVIAGRLPPEHGWYTFATRGRSARWSPDSWAELPDAVYDERAALSWLVRGIAIGDRLVPEGAAVPADERALVAACEAVHLMPAGLARFASVVAGRPYEGGPLVYVEEAPGDAAADAVARAWEDGLRDVGDVPGVSPALDLAFRLAWAERDEATRRREAAEREARRREMERSTGSAVGRRTLAALDFGLAARAALAVSGAEYLDHRGVDGRPAERAIRFRLDARRFECVVHAETLQVVEAGLCLTGYDERGDVEIDGDELLSLEALPSVYLEAIRTGVLHLRRNA
jgi:hypothetical protein